jgi:hypothetical protein
MNTRIPGPPDANLLLGAGATMTATANKTAINLGTSANPGLGGRPMQAGVPIVAADFASANETYDLILQQSVDNSTFTDVSPTVRVVAGDVGNTVLVGGFVTQQYVRVRVVISGTTPSLQHGDIYLHPTVNAA